MRFEAYGRGDTPDRPDMDAGFTGIDMTRDKPLIGPGMLSLGQNTRLRTGRVRQRDGTIIPNDFNPLGGFGNLINGSHVYRNPNSDEVLLISPRSATAVWVLQYGKDPYFVNVVAGTQDTGAGLVRFCQAFEKVVLFRVPASGTGNLVWDGVSTTDFEVMTLSADGNTLVPLAWNGEPFMDRVIYYSDNFNTLVGTINRDRWVMSDIEDYTSYDPAFQAFRTNPAESDYITRILAYFRGSVVIFKNQSIHMAQLLPTFPVSITQRILNSTIGSIGNRMPIMIGAEVYFLSQPNGFYRLNEVIQDQITAAPVPYSEPIQSVIDQINWGVTAIWGCSVALSNYVFHGVSLGIGATRLNTILVYDTQQKQWVSAGDTWRDPGFAFNALHVTNYQGVGRIFAVDYAESTVYLLYEGVNDNLRSGTFSVPFRMTSRGYFGDDPIAFKRFGRAQVGIATYDPSITVTAIMDGFNEEKVLTPIPITKSRLEWYPHGHAPFDPLTSSATEPKRKDYSVTGVDDFAIEDFEAYPVGEILFVSGQSPVTVRGDLQESVERLLVRSFGRWACLDVRNDSGVVEVTSCGIESTHAMSNSRTVA